jgi:UDP-glucose 4-epimerase
MKLLVTGGAGYIGSHIVLQAQAAGHTCTVVDDLSTGLSERVNCELVTLDITSASAQEQLASLLAKGFDAVIHLAAKKQVGESVEKPELYYQDNIGGLANLLLAMRATQTKKLVFSSSAAVYGMPDVERVSESTSAKPINPYGETKLVGEWMVRNASHWGLRGVSLRYFNAAGTGRKGLADTAALNLIPIAIGQLRRGETPVVFGNDYPTEDGSCIRDYVHVTDLAEAHIAAVNYLEKPDQPFDVFNIGTGVGASVLDVLKAIKSVSGKDFDPVIGPRRAGDPPRLVADVARMNNVLGLRTKLVLKDIVESAWNL